MLKLETHADLEALVENQVQEGLSLEYKDSKAAANTDKSKLEIAKDAAAMANAAGGQIVFGITEENHLPGRVDEGLDPAKYNGLWFEQVIQQNVRAQIEGLAIQQIPLPNNNIAIVVTIPQALARAPHQLARDGRYYRRRNFRNDVMEDYEVREAMNRQARPDLFATFHFAGGAMLARFSTLRIDGETDIFPLFMKIGNRSPQPALHTIARIYLDSRIRLLHDGKMEDLGMSGASYARDVRILAKRIGLPNGFPIFKEDAYLVPDPNLVIQIPILPIWPEHPPLLIGYDIRTPGYHVEQLGTFRFHDPLSVGLVWDEPKIA